MCSSKLLTKVLRSLLTTEQNIPQKEIYMNRIAAISLFVAATLITAGSAAAQSNIVEVNVPFNFTVNGAFLRAGTYTFGFDSTLPDLLIVRDQRKSVMARGLGERGSISSGKPRTLRFHRYGGQYFLSEVLFDSASNGIFLPAAKLEKRARKANRQEDLASIAAD